MPVLTRTRGLLPLAAMLAFVPAILPAQTIIGPAGSPAGGAAFSDQCPAGVAGLTVRAGWWVDGLMIHCQASPMVLTMPARGGAGGEGRTFLLNAGERITAVSGTWSGPAGAYIYSIDITTSAGRTFSFGNGGTDRGRTPYRLEVPAGMELRGLSGRASDYLYALGLVVGPGAGGMAAPATVAPAAPSSGKGAPVTPSPAAPASGGAVVYEARPIRWNDGSGGYCPQPNGVCSDPMSGLRWRSTSGGAIPAEALNLGAGAARVYACVAEVAPRGAVIGRFDAANRIVGTLTPASRGCELAIAGQTVLAAEYEVLVALPTGGIWVNIINGSVGRAALQASVSDGASLAVCTTSEGGALQVGWTSEAISGCMTAYRGTAQARFPYRVAIRDTGGS